MINQAYQIINSTVMEMEAGIDVENRRIYLTGEILTEDALFLLQRINLINKLTPNDDDIKKPIELYINSGGGDVYGMFAMVDIIQNSPSPIITIGTGQIMSAATLIFAAGTGGRYLTKNATVMNHEMSDAFFGKVSDTKIQQRHTEDLEKKCWKLLSEFTGKTQKF
jgi:ATP-dependent protease ClpP protease subunit